MAKFVRDFETVDEARRRLARDDQAEPLMVETDMAKVLEEQLPKLVIEPGSHHAAAAFRAGREDEYADRMRSKYGGEW